MRYICFMFAVEPCAAGCGRPAVSGSRLCARHTADPLKEAGRISEYISSIRTIRDLNAAGLHFESADFSHRIFYGCNFEDASFNMCLFTCAQMRMVFFPFAKFENCDFSRSDLQFLNFAGTAMLNCSFESSELIHLNFNGTVLRGCTFNNSNLYNSRFVNAEISVSDFVDCNLKRTNFFRVKQDSVSFKSSNTAEAIFGLNVEGE